MKTLVDVKRQSFSEFHFLWGSYLGARLATYMPDKIRKKSIAGLLVVIASKMYFNNTHYKTFKITDRYL
ncbi:hypothetical protein [Ohtaekwangia koreensis]|uniref:Uncharacterized protein n=1 Tax=Ohtaekwangia koreensis TaxID=688867 RepID=A0A1T5M674_9BACT|nr:hypothetical protein [Ohtaekwangia koreensis]SKC83623.1 hypothetical protein SAMN05660236_4500 [Ohtaekwangia koreensis]